MPCVNLPSGSLTDHQSCGLASRPATLRFRRQPHHSSYNVARRRAMATGSGGCGTDQALEHVHPHPRSSSVSSNGVVGCFQLGRLARDVPHAWLLKTAASRVTAHAVCWRCAGGAPAASTGCPYVRGRPPKLPAASTWNTAPQHAQSFAASMLCS
jgi:hypothetical protein